MLSNNSFYKSDQRCLFLYVISDDFQIFFPSEEYRQRCNDLVLEITENEELTDLDSRNEAEVLNVSLGLVFGIRTTTTI